MANDEQEIRQLVATWMAATKAGRMFRAGTASRYRVDSWRRFTALPISTAANPMLGDISAKFKTPANRPT
jgi:hypothetical protein